MNYTKIFLIYSVFITTLLFISCSETVKDTTKNDNKTIKDAYKNNFYIGTALNTNQINEVDSIQKKIIANEFNAITAENIMKSALVHPTEDEYDFELTDKFVELGEKNNSFIHGHTLIWHSQLSPFFNKIKDSTEMVKAMSKHINSIAGRYKGKIHSWDVLNEALNDDGTLRKTPFLDALGEDYIALSFTLAAKAAPGAELYYNDYSMTNPKKREGAIELIKTSG